MKVTVIVPYRPDPRRDRLLEVVRARLRHALEGAFETEVILMDDLRGDGELFNRPQAINMALKASDGEIVVINDADTTHSTASSLRDAIQATMRDMKWRLPARYHQLAEGPTDAILDAPKGLLAAARVQPDESEVIWTGDGVCWSGIVVVPRVALEAVRGGDQRYRGWGADDVALALALKTLYAPPVRYEGDAVHLWHPRGEQENGKHRFSVEERQLTERYMAADGDKKAIRALIRERE